MRLLIAAGGTGGHIYPGLTIAESVKRKYPGAQILFVGSDRGLERELVPRYGFDLQIIPLSYLERKLSLAILGTAWRGAKGTLEALAIIRRFKPDLVIGTGGYVAGPVLLAAVLSHRKILIQEQNAYPGVTNRLLSRFADGLALGYQEAARLLPCRGVVEVTGNPIRREVAQVSRAEGSKRMGLDASKRILVVTGGSQGARSINRAVEKAAPKLKRLSGWQILHATGKRHFTEIARSVYRITDPNVDRIEDGNMVVVPYIHDMPAAYGCADLVVSRAGALSIAEITARGIAAIYVPFPYAAEDHQRKNAEVMVNHGAAVMILDSELTGDRFFNEVLNLAQNPEKLKAMAQASKQLGRPDATERVLALIERLVGL